jgi:hypothetical protein
MRGYFHSVYYLLSSLIEIFDFIKKFTKFKNVFFVMQKLSAKKTSRCHIKSL